ncbi:MAG: sigma-70 family RNA polymerase sigma factor [Candidatus Dormibacteraeota bacterium]|nr:sigma-70 family RNA polymerase sigma factor [Candidatus Dormibacteraeota bacterium]
MAALQRGDIAGLTDLVRLHQLKALRTAYGILGDRAAAEDLVSESFLKVYDRIGSYDAGRPFEPWYYRLLVNAAIDYRRKSRRWQAAELPAVDPAAGGLEAHELRISLRSRSGSCPPSNAPCSSSITTWTWTR